MGWPTLAIAIDARACIIAIRSQSMKKEVPAALEFFPSYNAASSHHRHLHKHNQIGHLQNKPARCVCVCVCETNYDALNMQSQNMLATPGHVRYGFPRLSQKHTQTFAGCTSVGSSTFPLDRSSTVLFSIDPRRCSSHKAWGRESKLASRALLRSPPMEPSQACMQQRQARRRAFADC